MAELFEFVQYSCNALTLLSIGVVLGTLAALQYLSPRLTPADAAAASSTQGSFDFTFLATSQIALLSVLVGLLNFRRDRQVLETLGVFRANLLEIHQALDGWNVPIGGGGKGLRDDKSLERQLILKMNLCLQTLLALEHGGDAAQFAAAARHYVVAAFDLQQHLENLKLRDAIPPGESNKITEYIMRMDVTAERLISLSRYGIPRTMQTYLVLTTLLSLPFWAYYFHLLSLPIENVAFITSIPGTVYLFTAAALAAIVLSALLRLPTRGLNDPFRKHDALNEALDFSLESSRVMQRVAGVDAAFPFLR